MAKSRTQMSLSTRAVELVRAARAASIELRLFGSTAVVARCSRSAGFLRRNMRNPRDIDIVARSSQYRAIEQFMITKGLKRRALMPYLERGTYTWRIRREDISVEVSYDDLAFVHRLSCSEDFSLSFPTLSLETLVMSKLQMRAMNPSDLAQLAGLLIEWSREERTEEAFGTIVTRASKDFRCWRDFLKSLELVLLQRPMFQFEDDEEGHLTEGVAVLRETLDRVQQGIPWWIGRCKAALRCEPQEPQEVEA